ncbi:hypothetical protein [Aggregatibacter kilianii]|uniref:hypothetical protein n=1 Tax=Aggregatibacter kilianii TaxID=2025884 RepID=UPI000D65B21A|nr:hypothetical protein [Aggregatibacter kilianii]
MKTSKELIEKAFEQLAQHAFETRKLIGDLSQLDTGTKSNLVAALNEILTAPQSAGVDKNEVGKIIDEKLKAWINGAPEELDSLQEVAAEIKKILAELSKDDLASQAILTKLAGLQSAVDALDFSALPERITKILSTGTAE